MSPSTKANFFSQLFGRSSVCSDYRWSKSRGRLVHCLSRFTHRQSRLEKILSSSKAPPSSFPPPDVRDLLNPENCSLPIHPKVPPSRAIEIEIVQALHEDRFLVGSEVLQELVSLSKVLLREKVEEIFSLRQWKQVEVI